MANSARVIADSHYERNGAWFRVVTMVIVLYRGVLAEFNTHRTLSRNSASSRAIPVRAMLQKLARDLFVPNAFGTAIPKMNAGPALEGEDLDKAIAVWKNSARSQMWYALCLTTSPEYVAREWEAWIKAGNNDDTMEFVLDVADRIENKQHPIHQELNLLNVTKGLTNRLLEPFMYQEIIVTATEWENFFNLRTDKNAQEEIRTVAQMMKEAMEASTPVLLKEGDWHLPFIQDNEREWAKANPELAVKAVCARCARVSYLTHGTTTINLENDYRLADSLRQNGHMSPFEHALRPFTEEEWLLSEDGIRALETSSHREHVNPLFLQHQVRSLEFAGNVRGFVQARLELPGQDVFRLTA